MRTIKNIHILVLGLLLSLSTNPAFAAAYGSQITEVSFGIRNNDMSVDINDSVSIINITLIEATWLQKLTESLQSGVSIGYIDIDQDAYTGVQGYVTNGYKVGFGLRANLIKSQLLVLDLDFNFDYISTTGYTSTTGSSIDQRAEVTWFEYGGGVDLVLLPKNAISILGGASYTELDGEYRVDNSNDAGSTKLNFAAHSPEGYYGGIRIKTGGAGRIDMTWHGGTSEGFYLAFSNRF